MLFVNPCLYNQTAHEEHEERHEGHFYLHDMLRDIDNFYLQQEEPTRSCLHALRQYTLKYNKNITEAWKYRMPFFCYKRKMFCYIWLDKKNHLPYLGIVQGKHIDHPLLVQGERSRMKILMIDPELDLPVTIIDAIFKKAMLFYK